ncbi:MAG: MFS transporter, partial [Cereibacter sp.]
MPRHPALLVLALSAAGLGAAAQFGKISVIFDLLVADYGTPGRVAFMVSIVGLVGLVFGTTAGIFGQRIGLRRVLLGALLLGAALSAFQALLPPYPVMMASRILEGASHLGIVVAGPVLIAQTAPQRHQGLAMTLWSSFFGLSFAG